MSARLLALALLVIGCRHSQAPDTAAPRASTPVSPATPVRAVDTRVLSFEAGQTQAVLVGPFLVTTINPAGDLELMISPSGRCDDGLWFSYSGGGVAVPAGETLCAHAGSSGVQGFSGRAP